MGTALSTTNFHVQTVNAFVGAFANLFLDSCYFFVGDHVSHSNNIIQPANNDIDDVYINPYLKMEFGKKLVANNFLPAIINIPYTSNTVYAMYDDQDQNLLVESYYTIVNAGSFSHVFKVLDNNQGSISTVQPDFSQIVGSNNIIYQTSDGYRWKYMYSVDSATVGNTATPSYFPLIPNTQVVTSALAGTVDICKVIQGGSLYNNWSSGIFKTADIAINGDPTIFNLSNNQISTVNGFYNQCILYLTSGPGIGQFAVVNNSFSNTTGNFLRIANAFPIIPTNGTTFQVYPQYQVVGTGMESQQVIARALVNSTASNSIYRVEVLQRGIGFANVISSKVLANSVVGVNLQAQIRPILPPPGGHGANPAVELGATNLIIWAQLDDDEFATIPITNDYQQIGIINNPTFSNVHLILNLATLQFSTGETAYLVNPIQVQPQCNVQVGNNYVQSNNAAFTTQFQPGSPVLLVSNTGTLSQLVTVSSIVNTTFMLLTSNVNFSCTQVIAYNPNIYGNVVVTQINSLTDIVISNSPGSMTSGSMIVGTTSGAFAIIDHMVRNDVTKSFNTFVQLNKYSITQVSGTFIQDEVVMQGSVSGFFHSGNTGTVYLSSINGIVQLSGSNLIGQTSGAIAQITKIYPQEIVFGTGEILYLENINPITRQPNQTEAFRMVFNF